VLLPNRSPLVGDRVPPWPDIVQEGLAVAGPTIVQHCVLVGAKDLNSWPDIHEEGLASAGPTHMNYGCSGHAVCFFFIWPFITQEGPALAGLSGPEVH